MKLLESISAYLKYQKGEVKSIPADDKRIHKVLEEKRILTAFMAAFDEEKIGFSIIQPLRLLKDMYDNIIRQKLILDNFSYEKAGQKKATLEKDLLHSIELYYEKMGQVKISLKNYYVNNDFKQNKSLDYLYSIDGIYHSYYSEQKKLTGFFKNETDLLLGDIIQIQENIKHRLKLGKVETENRAEYKSVVDELTKVIKVITELKNKKHNKEEIALLKNIIRDAVAGKLLLKYSSKDIVDSLRTKIASLEVLLNEIDSLPTHDKKSDTAIENIKLLHDSIKKIKALEFDFLVLDKNPAQLSKEDQLTIKEVDETASKIFAWLIKVFPSFSFSYDFQELINHSVYSKGLDDSKSKGFFSSSSFSSLDDSQRSSTTPSAGHRRTTGGLLRGAGITPKGQANSPKIPLSPSLTSSIEDPESEQEFSQLPPPPEGEDLDYDSDEEEFSQLPSIPPGEVDSDDDEEENKSVLNVSTEADAPEEAPVRKGKHTRSKFVFGGQIDTVFNHSKDGPSPTNEEKSKLNYNKSKK